MTVHLHPTAARAPVAPGAFAPPDRTCGLADLARWFGLRHQTPQPTVAFVRLMIERQGFPAPLPRPKKGELLTGADAVAPTARWQLRAVDAWFDGLLPPGARDALAARAADEAGAALDERAENLDALIAGRRA